MAEQVRMPKLGATMEEGTIDNWLVNEGEKVIKGDPIVEIQTDKITIEVEAQTDGILLKKLYEVGDTVPVQKVIAIVGKEGERVELEEEDPPIANEENVTQNSVPIESGIKKDEKIRRTPVARRLAKDYNINLANISGTGPNGRIQKRDVESYINQMKEVNITPLAKKIAEDQQIDVTKVSGSGVRGKITKADVLQNAESDYKIPIVEKVPFKGMRKVIATRMSESFYSAPHVTLFSEVDMTEVVKVRKQLLPVIEELEGVRISYNEIIIKAAALSLKKNPNINISLVDEKEIIYHANINIGIAVALTEGLVVPVIQNVDQKGLAAITKEAKALAEQARKNALTPEQMQGSTFTISNLGMYAVDGFTPIINQPNGAILGVGRIQEKPVVINGEVKVRSMMTLSLSFDHRTIDGAPAAQFLTDLKDLLEHPYKLMV